MSWAALDCSRFCRPFHDGLDRGEECGDLAWPDIGVADWSVIHALLTRNRWWACIQQVLNLLLPGNIDAFRPEKDMMAEPQERAWHVDRTVNLSIVFMVVAQFAIGVWWVSQVSSRLESAITTNDQQTARIVSIESVINAQAINAATTAAQLTALGESLKELKDATAETNRLLRGLSIKGINE